MTDQQEHKAFGMDGPAQLRALFELLQAEGYRIAGPKVKQHAVVFDFLENFAELPVGCRDSQEPGRYRLQEGQDAAFFGYSVGPQSLKGILHPARRRLMTGDRSEGSWAFHSEDYPEEPIALFGIRSCDLHALWELDKVFLESGYVDAAYASRRRNLFIVTATCVRPSAVCFCSSMHTGPQAESGYDINLSEFYEAAAHRFLARAGSGRGELMLSRLSLREASEEARQDEKTLVQRSREAIRKHMPTDGLPQFLQENLEHERWKEVAERCLSCGNCTMVCPTCFCTTVEDVTDLTGTHTERWLRWDSCFTADFSFIHGGVVRPSTLSRYRQWLVHKLSTWHKQFHASGCVGCGRCISWCPVGIDLTEEVQAMRGHHAEPS